MNEDETLGIDHGGRKFTQGLTIRHDGNVFGGFLRLRLGAENGEEEIVELLLIALHFGHVLDQVVVLTAQGVGIPVVEQSQCLRHGGVGMARGWRLTIGAAELMMIR